MKLNKKGFMLAEVVIVASVIAGILITLYISLNRVAAAYEKRNRYYDIDAMYAAVEINEAILYDTSSEKEYTSSLTTTNLNEVGDTTSRLKKIIDFYPSNVYPLKMAYYVNNLSDVDNLKNLKNDDKYFNEYIDYLNDNIEFSKYDYLIIIELQKDKDDPDDIYFYTLKVGDSSEA